MTNLLFFCSLRTFREAYLKIPEKFHRYLQPALRLALGLLFVRDADGVWCDAGPWEGVPVTLSRAWDPSLPVVGVLADIPKPAFLASRIGSVVLRGASARLAGRATSDRLTARRFLSLVTRRWADPVVVEPPDVLITPRLGRMNALQFGRIGPAVAIGERDTLAALGGIGPATPREMVTHAV